MGKLGRPKMSVNTSKKHYTKAEIEAKRLAEIKGNNDNIKAPDFLTDAKQQQEFAKIANELIELGIMSNLDCDVLGQYIQSKDSYIFYSNSIEKIKKGCKTLESLLAQTGYLKEFEGMKDKAFKQCQTIANSLGLTISSRCKLVAPKPAEQPKSKWEVYGTGKVGSG